MWPSMAGGLPSDGNDRLRKAHGIGPLCHVRQRSEGNFHREAKGRRSDRAVSTERRSRGMSMSIGKNTIQGKRLLEIVEQSEAYDADRKEISDNNSALMAQAKAERVSTPGRSAC